MKIAYLTSLYPAVSHTFILNEVRALRELGVEIGTFSVRAASDADILGEAAQAETRTTRSLQPVRPAAAVKAIAWASAARFTSVSAVIRGSVLSSSGLKAKLKWLAYFVEGALLAQWLVDGRYTRLHCHFGNSGSSVAYIAARIAGVPFSMTCHGSELNDPLGFRLPEKVRASAFTACVSKFGRARLMHVCPREDWGRVSVVRCGIRRVSISPYPSEDGLGPEILCIGRLSAEKGHFVLLDAIEILQRRSVKARLTIIGDGPLRDELAERARTLPDPGAVMFTGSLPPDKVSEHLKACSLVALASFSEGVPLVLMEAFSHGRPVVSTWVGGIPELVRDGESGLLVAPGDAKEMASALETLVLDPALSEAMGKRGAGMVEREFMETDSAARLKALFAGEYDGGAFDRDMVETAGEGAT